MTKYLLAMIALLALYQPAQALENFYDCQLSYSQKDGGHIKNFLWSSNSPKKEIEFESFDRKFLLRIETIIISANITFFEVMENRGLRKIANSAAYISAEGFGLEATEYRMHSRCQPRSHW